MPKKRPALLLALFLCLPLACAQARDYRYSDAHLHYVDFFQETDGMQKLLKAMDAGGIDHVMISGMSACRQDVPPYAMTQGDPAVVVGINRVGLHRAGWSSSKLTELREAYRCFRNGLEGKGELFDQLEAFREGSQRGIMKFGRAR